MKEKNVTDFRIGRHTADDFFTPRQLGDGQHDGAIVHIKRLSGGSSKISVRFVSHIEILLRRIESVLGFPRVRKAVQVCICDDEAPTLENLRNVQARQRAIIDSDLTKRPRLGRWGEQVEIPQML